MVHRANTALFNTFFIIFLSSHKKHWLCLQWDFTCLIAVLQQLFFVFQEWMVKRHACNFTNLFKGQCQPRSAAFTYILPECGILAHVYVLRVQSWQRNSQKIRILQPCFCNNPVFRKTSFLHMFLIIYCHWHCSYIRRTEFHLSFRRLKFSAAVRHPNAPAPNRAAHIHYFEKPKIIPAISIKAPAVTNNLTALSIKLLLIRKT